MDNRKRIVPAVNSVSIDAESIDRLIRRADGSAALLYIYILRCGGLYDEEAAAKSLKMGAAEIRCAFKVLTDDGLIVSDEPAPGPDAAPVQHLPDEEMPQYDSNDIKNKLAADAGFSRLVLEVQSMLGKLLSSEDTMKLYAMYDDLGLPSEVILHLINFCIRSTQRRLGPGRMPTMRSIQRIAYEWEREGITTLPAAEEYIRISEERSVEAGDIAAALQIRGRQLTATEKEYISSWMQMGFKADAAEIAYDRTVTRTGRLSWKYMDSIFKSWHGKGLHTPKEIESGDGREPRGTDGRDRDPAAQRQSATAADLERMKRYLEADNK